MVHYRAGRGGKDYARHRGQVPASQGRPGVTPGNRSRPWHAWRPVAAGSQTVDRRSNRMATKASVSTTELPPAIEGPCAWYGPDIVGRTEWIEHLSSAELDEIRIAAERLATMEV